MPVASGGGRPRYVPRADDRDQDGLSEELRLISYHLAKFLRHEAPKKKYDEWIDVESVIEELQGGDHNLTVSPDDLLKVVRESYSKDRARFEEWADADGKIMVRAANAEHYRTRGRKTRSSYGSDYRDDRSDCGSSWSEWSGAGSSVGGYSHQSRRGGWKPRGAYNRNHRERDYGGSSRFPDVPENEPATSSAAAGPDAGGWRSEAASSSQCFDGPWETKDGNECSISGTNVTWKTDDGAVHQDAYIEGKTIWILDPNDKRSWGTEGWLSDAGDKIEFKDEDVWYRKGLREQQQQASASSSAGAGAEASAATEAAGKEAPAAKAQAATAASSADAWAEQHGGSAAASSAIAADGSVAGADAAAEATAATAASDSCGVDTQAAPSSQHCVGVDWVEQYVKQDWQGKEYGDDYLTLHKGELLNVQPEHEEGWAWGYSVQREKFGWFPPTYAYAQEQEHAA